MRKPKPKSLMREVAYERFKAQLFKRNLVPGQFVSQGELCALLDVPLGPTREALKRLEAESLVRLIPQRGIQIADIGVTLIHEAFEFRTILELAAVRHFALHHDDATLARIEEGDALDPEAPGLRPGNRFPPARCRAAGRLGAAQSHHRIARQPHPDQRAPAELRQDQDDPTARTLAALPAARHGGAPRRSSPRCASATRTQAAAALARHLAAAERRALGM